MKKAILSIALLLCIAVTAAAQEKDPAFHNKRGVALLPQAGDFAIGIDASPFLNYMGGFFSEYGSSAPEFYGFNGTIYGKYFLTDNTAIRVNLGLDFSSYKHKATITDDYRAITEPTNPLPTTIDMFTEKHNDFDLKIGYEMRRGKGRVQGFYGGELSLSVYNRKYSHDYGNPITALNQTPTTHNFNGNMSSVADFYRTLNVNMGTAFGFGLGGFVGVEYFFAPQISLGGEFSLNFRYFVQGQSTIVDEGFINGELKQYEYRTRNAYTPASIAGLYTLPEGRLFLMFYF